MKKNKEKPVKHEKEPAGTYALCGWKRAWIMWDLDNGHAWSKKDNGKGYLWVFRDRKSALTHRRKQHKMKYGARLSMPVKIATADRV